MELNQHRNLECFGASNPPPHSSKNGKDLNLFDDEIDDRLMLKKLNKESILRDAPLQKSGIKFQNFTSNTDLCLVGINVGMPEEVQLLNDENSLQNSNSPLQKYDIDYPNVTSNSGLRTEAFKPKNITLIKVRNPEIFPQIRLERLGTMLSHILKLIPRNRSPPVFCLLATYSNILPMRLALQINVYPSDTHRNIELKFKCGYCSTIIIINDILHVLLETTTNETINTYLILKKLLTLHDNNCVVVVNQKSIGGDICLSKEEGRITKTSSETSINSNTEKLEVEWIPDKNERETLKHSFPKGDIMYILPEMMREVYNKFGALTSFHLLKAKEEYGVPKEEERRLPFEPLKYEPRNTCLDYFFVQTPPSSTGEATPISIQDARRRIREVHYDRGTIVNQMDIEAKEMADCKKRHDSFFKSEHLKGKVAAYQLAQLGFFFVGDRNAVGKLRCSFCRRTIHMFVAEDAQYLTSDFDRRLSALLFRHSHLSATCPFSLHLNGDDKKLSVEDMARILDPLIRTQQVQFPRIEFDFYQQPELNHIRNAACSLLPFFADEIPALDGKYSDEYNELLAELCYEPFTQFDNDEAKQMDYELDELIPNSTPIDYYIGAAPKFPAYWTLQSRIDTFNADSWREHPISQWRSDLLKPESLARAGLYYSGTADNVMCFWCGLGLNNWEQTDEPVTEHAKFAPRCTWILRTSGRQRIKWIYIKTQGAQQSVQGLKPGDYAFLKDVDDIPGGLEVEHLCPVDFRTELREAKSRLDLPANRAILDQFGFSVDLTLHAIESQLKETGNDYVTGEHLVETLWAYEHWKVERKIDTDADFIARAEDLKRGQVNQSQQPSAHSEAQPAGSVSHTRRNEAIESEAISDENLCVVCMVNQRAVTLIPCGHLAICQSCYSRLQQCPVCRTVIRGSIRSYTSETAIRDQYQHQQFVAQ